jgi:hypothetical protein
MPAGFDHAFRGNDRGHWNAPTALTLPAALAPGKIRHTAQGTWGPRRSRNPVEVGRDRMKWFLRHDRSRHEWLPRKGNGDFAAGGGRSAGHRPVARFQ